MPCSSRAAISSSAFGASPQSTDASGEPDDAEHEDPPPPEPVAQRAAEQDQRGQRQRVAVTVHCSEPKPTCRSRPMFGRATLTTVASMPAMPEPRTHARTIHRPDGDESRMTRGAATVFKPAAAGRTGCRGERRARRVGTGQPGDQVQRHVDTGGDAGGGDDVAVVDEAVVRGATSIVGSSGGQLVECRQWVVAGRPRSNPAAAYTSAAGADAGHQRAARGKGTESVEHVVVAHQRTGAVAAGHHQYVDAFGVAGEVEPACGQAAGACLWRRGRRRPTGRR